MIETLVQDVRAAFRQFRKQPGFTLTVVLVLALGLGANTAIFSVVNAFLLRPLPFRDPARLTALYERNVVGNDEPFNWVAPGTFLDWRRLSTSFEQIAAYALGSSNLAAPGSSLAPQRADTCACTANLFATLGVRPALGRDFRPDEDRWGAPHVAIISYGLWQQHFGGAPNIIGRRIWLDGENTEVVGVMPRGFAFPSRTVEVWQPLLPFLPPERQQRHDTHFLQTVGRLRPGVSIEQARAEIDGINARYKRLHPNDVAGRGGNVAPLHAALVRDVRTPLLILLGAVVCVLLIACINVANLLLTRAAGRMREVSIRAAIGASRGRIIRQLLTESILLAFIGAAAGLLLAVSITDVLVSHAPGADAIVPAGHVGISVAVFAFAFGVALLTGIAAGLFPALQSSRADLANGLKDTSRSATPGRSHATLRRTLIVAEVGVSLALLLAAGLLLHSFARVYQVNPGVRIDHSLTMAMSLPDAVATHPERVSAFASQLGDRLRAIPGVLDAGIVSCAPLGGHCNDLVFSIVGHPLPAGQMLDALNRGADPGYFSAAGIPLLSGRTFTRQDGIGFDRKHPRLGAIIISQAAAKRFFAHEDPLGRRITFGIDRQRQQITGDPVPVYQIVGVVGDVLARIDSKVEPTIYMPLLDGSQSEFYVVLHTAGDPRSVAAAARTEIAHLDPTLAVFQIHTMEELVGQSAADRRFNMLLFSSFAGLALLLAATGLYGVLSYAVSQRRSEIGIRMALGASSANVSGLILREGMKPAAVGVVVGLLGAAFACRILSSLLFGVGTADPLTFALAPLVLLLIAVLACLLPASRAARIDPTIALRME